MPDEMPFLVAPDKFKGTFRATQVAAAIGRGIERSGRRPPDLCPIADGGDGTAETLLLALGGETAAAEARDPLGRPITAGFVLIEDGAAAVVEVAAASGLALLADDEQDAEAATSAGTGDLILAAVEHGAEVVFVAAGGSATTDGGRGALDAIEDGGGLRGATIVVLSDVRVPWERAAAVFGPQKGADPPTVARLERRLDQLAGRLAKDPRGEPMTGAAGGLAGGLWAEHGAQLVPGAPFVLDTIGYDARMRAARAVVVGEGALDASSLMGKAVGEAATRARQAGVPCGAITGRNDLSAFDARIIDLQVIREATTIEELEQAGEEIADLL